MNPIATACQSGDQGNGVPRSFPGRSITRQRIVRSGNVRVASATAASSRTGSTALRPARTSLQCVPRTAHARKAPVTARPTTQAQREARLGDGAGGEGGGGGGGGGGRGGEALWSAAPRPARGGGWRSPCGR